LWPCITRITLQTLWAWLTLRASRPLWPCITRITLQTLRAWLTLRANGTRCTWFALWASWSLRPCITRITLHALRPLLAAQPLSTCRRQSGADQLTDCPIQWCRTFLTALHGQNTSSHGRYVDVLPRNLAQRSARLGHTGKGQGVEVAGPEAGQARSQRWADV
jgi:hypothetical protein